MKPRHTAAMLAALLATGLLSCSAENDGELAQQQTLFYRGKTIQIFVGTSPGGGNDSMARLLARHLARHIPGNPSIVVQNMPGAGSFLAANHLFNTAAKDGTATGIFSEPTPYWAVKNAHYDPRKSGWIGGLARRGGAFLLVPNDAPAITLEGAREKEIVLSATSNADAYGSYARLANDLIGTKFKLVLGYAGTSEIYLAMKRGEVHGIAGASWSALKVEHPRWITDGFATPMFLFSLQPEPDLAGVPPIADFARNETDRAVIRLVLGMQQFSRSFSTPGEVPPDRLALLRAALKATYSDPAFLADAACSLLEKPSYAPPKAITAFLQEANAAPAEIKTRVMIYIGDE